MVWTNLATSEGKNESLFDLNFLLYLNIFGEKWNIFFSSQLPQLSLLKYASAEAGGKRFKFLPSALLHKLSIV